MRIVEPAEILGNGVIRVAPRSDPAPQPLFQRPVLRRAVRRLVRIARIGALHDADGEVEIGDLAAFHRDLRPGRQQQPGNGRDKRQNTQQDTHLFQRRT